MMDAEDLLLGGLEQHGAMDLNLSLHADVPQDDLHDLDLQLHEAPDFMLEYGNATGQGGSAFDDLFVMPTMLAATQAGGGTQGGKAMASPAKGATAS